MKGELIMKRENTLISTRDDSWKVCYKKVEDFAKTNNLINTQIALKMATELHSGQTRKSGEPYIIHPLQVTIYLITLGVKDDIMLAAAMLHDTVEDCKDKLSRNGEEFTLTYNLNPDILRIVLLLTKTKGYVEKDYYERIKKDPRALLIKLSDRANNCSTMVQAFNKDKMIKYVDETITYYYDLCKYGKAHFPEFSNHITIIKYKLTSICETIEALLSIDKILPIEEHKYLRTLLFIKGFAIGKEMPNTLKALSMIQILYKDKKRRSGDPYIIHPLKVCSYLISLKICSDKICAAALIHELFKDDNDPLLIRELLKTYSIDSQIIDIVKLLCKPKNMSLNEYYLNLRTCKEAVLIRLSNRANTCTTLHSYEEKEKEEYISEYDNHIVPLFSYAKTQYPELSNQIDNMDYHITVICQIVRANFI